MFKRAVYKYTYLLTYLLTYLHAGRPMYIAIPLTNAANIPAQSSVSNSVNDDCVVPRTKR